MLDLAVGRVAADAYLTLEGVHRFTRSGPDGRALPDVGYADLTLAMRVGDDSGMVFDTLLARGRSDGTLTPTRCGRPSPPPPWRRTPTARQVSVVVDTRDQAAVLAAAIRGRLVAAGRVHDTLVVTHRRGGADRNGDRVATHRNDRNLDVANRDIWIVAGVGGTVGCGSPRPDLFLHLSARPPRGSDGCRATRSPPTSSPPTRMNEGALGRRLRP